MQHHAKNRVQRRKVQVGFEGSLLKKQMRNLMARVGFKGGRKLENERIYEKANV